MGEENTRECAVLVFDMAHTGQADGEYLVRGFRTMEAAKAYASARMRASVEELRKPDITADELRRLWHIFGEDCSVIGGNFRASDLLDEFIAEPATPEQIEWCSSTPKRRGRPGSSPPTYFR